MRVVVLVFGKDGVCFPSGPSNRVLVDGVCPTVIPGTEAHPAAASICGLLADLGVCASTVETVPQDGCFAMVVLAEWAGTNLDGVRRILQQKGEALGLTLRVQREDVFRAMHRI
ncbi:MAG: ACT domain-containing protein [Candidatus Xenobia bacterium]